MRPDEINTSEWFYKKSQIQFFVFWQFLTILLRFLILKNYPEIFQKSAVVHDPLRGFSIFTFWKNCYFDHYFFISNWLYTHQQVVSSLHIWTICTHQLIQTSQFEVRYPVEIQIGELSLLLVTFQFVDSSHKKTILYSK